MQIKDIMVPDVVLIHPDDRLRDANERMRSLDLDPFPVWDGCKVVGTLTRKGVREFAQHAGIAAGSTRVVDAMSRNVPFCWADEEIVQIRPKLEAARREGSDGLLVLDREGRVVGIVSEDDIASGLRRSTPAVTAALGAAAPKDDVDTDPVDHWSEESFPASDPPPSSLQS